MPPAPATIASMPRQSSRTCWNPAVPPPPVPGAAAGNESGDWLGGGGVLADCGLADCGLADCGLADCGLGGGRLGLGVVVLGVGVLGVLTEVVALGVPLAEVVGVGGPVPPGENEGGVVGGEPDEQADTDAVASMAKAAQPRTVPRKRRRP
jgi:hypothetical protein